MNYSIHRLVAIRKGYRAGGLILTMCLAASTSLAIPCSRTKAQQDFRVERSVNALVRAARGLYERDEARAAYERVVHGIARTIARCRLTADSDFQSRYPEFIDYVRVLSLALKEDHELGFEVSDEVYFSETSGYTQIPEFLLTPTFLGAVSRFENLSQAKALLRQMNAARAPGEQLLFFSYASRHLGTPDNPDSYRRLLIVVPGDLGQKRPEKWVQFGIPDPRKPASVRNVSVVAVMPAANGTTNVYFKDYYRTYGRNGEIFIKGRWELGEGDDNCVECHKSGVLPVFPVNGSVSHEELPFVAAVNDRFLGYGPARFDRYLDAAKFGPGLGSTRAGRSAADKFSTAACTSCHHEKGLGALNWPMNSTLISSFVQSGRMPMGANLRRYEHAQLYRQLIEDYFSISNVRPGILKAWLLGKSR
jgi:hypothetical protein